MADLVVVFRTHSGIEAQIVRGLLESHGVVSAISSAEGTANPAYGGRALSLGGPLLSLAAGVALGYGATRWLRPWL